MKAKLQSINLTLSLQLAGIIVKEQIQDPDFVEAKEYQEKLFKTFNIQYEIKDIEQELEILLGGILKDDEILVYPDQHIEGI